MIESKKNSMLVSLCIGLVSMTLLWGGIVFFLRVFNPEPPPEAVTPFDGYPTDLMQRAVTPEAVRRELDTIASFGSRFLGQPGFYETENYIRQAYESAGLEVYEQENWTVAPRTVHREISTPAGAPLPDVEIYPFMPNHMQPMVTPDEGITGRLVLLTEETLRTRSAFDDAIGLLTGQSDQVAAEFGFSWAAYAQLGLKAIIVAHPDGLEAVEWNRVCDRNNGIVSSQPINFVRLAATKEIFNYVGRDVRLRVRTEYAETRNTTLIGVLRARRPAASAVLVTTYYDASSILPDRAPGTLQAGFVAAHLAFLKGLTQYRDSLQRDVVFVSFGARMMACAGQNNLLRALGRNPLSVRENKLLKALGIETDRDGGGAGEGTEGRLELLTDMRKRRDANDSHLEIVQTILDEFAAPGFLSDVDETAEALDRLEARGDMLEVDPKTVAVLLKERPVDEFFKDQIRYVLNTRVFETSERRLRKKIAFMRDDVDDLTSPAFMAFQEETRKYDKAMAAAGYSILNLLERKKDYVETIGFRRLCQTRFEELRDFHVQKKKRLDQDFKIVGVFNGYGDFVVVEPLLIPALEGSTSEETVSFTVGDLESREWQRRGEKTPPRAAEFRSILSSARERLRNRSAQEDEPRGFDVTVLALAKNQDWDVEAHINTGLQRNDAVLWTLMEYPCFPLVNLNRSESYKAHSYPVELPRMRDTTTIRSSLQLAGETILSLAHGNGSFSMSRLNGDARTYGGRVLVANVGQSIVPNYPLKNALLACRSSVAIENFSYKGFFEHPMYMTDVYGTFFLYQQTANFVVWENFWATRSMSPLAAGFGDDGLIAYMKDEGEEGQRQFKSTGLGWYDRRKQRDITIVVFRASPVSVLDLANPQSMKNYTDIELIARDGLARLRKQCIYRSNNRITWFVEPDEYVYVKLLAGTPENEYARETRAFILGINDTYELDPRKEVDGQGYLAHDTPVMLDVPSRAVRSMLYLNGKRLALQERHGMADERMLDFQSRSEALFDESRQAGTSQHYSTERARDAVTYSTLNYPVIRESIFEAVIGIVWYLGLLVPFTFFFERLVFGFTDIRKQLAAQGATFLVVFALLRLLHPAFQMIRSSIMILLGFVIVLTAGGVSVLALGKFSENLEELRKKRGKVSGAEVNTMGVMGIAFLLGLNNMHRRRVRTGLTCITLTLMTFVMICFTSIESNLVDKATASGKASYQGILAKEKSYRPFTGATALRKKYGDRYRVCLRKMTLGMKVWSDVKNPALTISVGRNGDTREVGFLSILQFCAEEPLRDQFNVLTSRKWFTEEQDRSVSGPLPIMIPDAMASKLGISIADVDREPVEVRINGRACVVWGVFEAAALNNLRDLDGSDLLPFDAETLENVRTIAGTGKLLAATDDPRVMAGQLILAPDRPHDIQAANAGLPPRIVSVAVHMPELGYKEARAEIEKFLEQSGKPAYFGLDGVSYLGERTRKRTMTGLVELLIPLIIAAMTVLNTMRGSVYERRDEIYVYNSVGIAPRYIFFMFFAEALVYAVVGSVMGYILSQGTGRILTIMNFTGGLKMTFTSLTTIYASLAVAAAVFLSTYFPAKSAMEIAAPAEESGWDLPEPDGDDLAFDLPFTFDYRDRIAIMTFFERYLSDFGEGGSGRFFASVPSVGIGDEGDPLEDNAPIPEISATIWLKPFDLGVSQNLIIDLPMDSETGEYKARITLHRLSGTKESWLRLNRGFVRLIREHFLHWRAVDPEERTEMFVEARAMIERQLATVPVGLEN